MGTYQKQMNTILSLAFFMILVGNPDTPVFGFMEEEQSETSLHDSTTDR
ncbi:hypothetical protein SLEP1_g15371 [Rubroshorea leprosula]|uniref:Uncharacterized protein n=1 Tax=Rubroshorea leprosula TaxID=152421 RepID=A0AAV5IT16_9ROSI|nr:hypothetical protein SLEP1_g15371 [Rubroshorea leprosula]